MSMFTAIDVPGSDSYKDEVYAPSWVICIKQHILCFDDV